MTDAASTSEWRNAFLPIGVRIGERWEPRGGGVLLLERPFVWLVTARAVVTGCADASPSVWVPRSTGHGLLDLGQTAPVAVSILFQDLSQIFVGSCQRCLCTRCDHHWP